MSIFTGARFCQVCEGPVRSWCRPPIPTLVNCEHSHDFCSACWQSWIITQINEGSMAIRCPSTKCNLEYCDVQSVLMSGFQKKATWEIYEDRILFHALHHQQANTLGCPKCFFIGWYEPTDACKNVTCRNCSLEICRTCLKQWHDGECDQASMGNLARQSEEFGAQAWISRYTKPCPSCKVRIQKNDGCSHMTCKMCRYEFCWICLGKYKGRHVPATSDKCHCDS